MKITVLNGSPKGDMSVTMQYVEYISRAFPGHTVVIHNISQRIKLLEKERNEFDAVLGDVRSARLVMWAFPLYYFLVPAQYKRFIELVFERKAASAFKSKYAAVLTTSIHFFDHTAHKYMRSICDDLDMKFAGSFSASMYDLMRGAERERLREFARMAFDAVASDMPAARAYAPVRRTAFVYRPAAPKKRIDTGGKKVLIIHDAKSGSSNLGKMVGRLKDSFAGEVPTVSLHDLDIKGGCLGCIQCGYDNRCVYGDSDGYHDFMEKNVKAADILFYGFETRDRYFSARWKEFFDRSFYNNHVPFLQGRQIGFLVSGPLSDMDALGEFLHAYPELQLSGLVDIVTDESANSRELDLGIQWMARKAVMAAEKGYAAPRTFLGVGGGKVFRDDIWNWLRFPFVADHRYYKSHGFYDFRKGFRKQRLVSSMLIALSAIRPFREVVYKQRMKEEMLKPLKSVLKRTRL
ncbi:MAG: NAD(P)H-dependent oxidoreductase [Spirochaetes bacterium]|nr:NAD(P)H-dependent oxidoreductase [Spirochaetota bacterium]